MQIVCVQPWKIQIVYKPKVNEPDCYNKNNYFKQINVSKQTEFDHIKTTMKGQENTTNN